MKTSWLVVGLLALAFAAANGCGSGAKTCEQDSHCDHGGVCYGGFCVDPASLSSVNNPNGDAGPTNDFDGQDGGEDAGVEPDGGPPAAADAGCTLPDGGTADAGVNGRCGS